MLDKTNYIVFFGRVDQDIVVGKQLCRWFCDEYMHATFNCIDSNAKMSACIQRLVVRYARANRCTDYLE
jgi:hypothetical protein